MSNMLDYLLYRTQMRKIASSAYAEDYSADYSEEQNAALRRELERMRARDEQNRAMAHKMYSGYLREIDRRQNELDGLRGSSTDIPQKSLGGRVASGMASVGNAVSKMAVPAGKGVNRAVKSAERFGRNVLRSTRKAGRKSLDWLRGR